MLQLNDSVKCRVSKCDGQRKYLNGLCAAHEQRRIKGQSLKTPIKRRIFGETIIKYPEYRAWTGLRYRCNNPNCPEYPSYGGRGIKVCKRWDSFENFLDDMGPRPGAGFSIERINNNRGYNPKNCKWATQTEQIRNRRNSLGRKNDTAK